MESASYRSKDILGEIKFSNHAFVRAQQRGISHKAISVVLEYGHSEYVKGGAKSWMMSKQEKEFAKADLGQDFINIEKQLGYLVISSDGVLITAAHSFKRLRK